MDGVFEEGGEEEETDELVGQVRCGPPAQAAAAPHGMLDAWWSTLPPEASLPCCASLPAMHLPLLLPSPHQLGPSPDCVLLLALGSRQQVLDEIGINLNASLVSAPGQKMAQAAPAAAAAQPVAQPLGAGEGVRCAAACRAGGRLVVCRPGMSAPPPGGATCHFASRLPAAGGGGGDAPGLDDDLQARLDRLRKS